MKSARPFVLLIHCSSSHFPRRRRPAPVPDSIGDDRAIQCSRDSRALIRVLGVLDAPQEPVIGLAEGEIRWRSMTAERDVTQRSRGTNASELSNRTALEIRRAQGRPGAHRTHGSRATKSTRQNHR
jgi:hypothetical protein